MFNVINAVITKQLLVIHIPADDIPETKNQSFNNQHTPKLNYWTLSNLLEASFLLYTGHPWYGIFNLTLVG